MSGCLGGCLGRLLAVLLLAIVVVAAWRFGPDVSERVADWRTPPSSAPSPELADRAMERYGRLLDGELERIELSGVELESILRHRLAQEFPPGVRDPSVEIRDGEVNAGVRVALELLPEIPELEAVRGILPDTVPVELTGVVVTLDGGRSAFIVRRIDSAGVPIPRRFHAAVASAVDPLRRPGLPAESIEIPLPPGVRALHVEGDRLVVTGGP